VGVIARVSPKLFYAHWKYFIPDSARATSPSLFTMISQDSCAKVRTEAVTVLTVIVEGSRPFMIAADERCELWKRHVIC
jgi:hypothetical protein